MLMMKELNTLVSVKGSDRCSKTVSSYVDANIFQDSKLFKTPSINQHYYNITKPVKI